MSWQIEYALEPYKADDVLEQIYWDEDLEPMDVLAVCGWLIDRFEWPVQSWN